MTAQHMVSIAGVIKDLDREYPRLDGGKCLFEPLCQS